MEVSAMARYGRIHLETNERGSAVMRQGYSTYLRYWLNSSDLGTGANAVVNLLSYGSDS